MGTKFEDEIRALHGADVIEIEPDGSDGRRFRVMKPTATMKSYPWYVRVLAGLGMIPIALFIVILAIGAVVMLSLLWIILTAH